MPVGTNSAVGVANTLMLEVEIGNEGSKLLTAFGGDDMGSKGVGMRPNCSLGRAVLQVVGVGFNVRREEDG